MKYLRKFATTADIDVDVEPNVVLVSESNRVFYNVKKGVFIQHIDGSLYTTEEWSAKGFANDVANGVAVCDPSASFVLAKKSGGSSVVWSSNKTDIIEGVTVAGDGITARADFAGKANTDKIAAFDTNSAAAICKRFTFPNGANGYLPSLGEWGVAYQYKSEIKSAMSLIGGYSPHEDHMWSSTQIDAARVWAISWYDGGATVSNKSSYKYLWVFTTLE
jgi:hypothetical protein